MSQSPFTFQPIPDACPIPRGIVTLIGGVMDEQRPSFALWRDREQIVIEARNEIDCREGLDPNDPHFEWWLGLAMRKMYTHYLEVIQKSLHNIDFRKTNWGYLIKDPKTNQHIIKQRKHILPSVSSPPWTTYIPEREVEFTVWGTCSDRRGIWKGKKVDVMYGWHKTEIWAVNKAMIGARATDGLDLTYDVYGHLLDDDGNIIGLVSEAATGRMIGLADKGRVYSAIAKLQAHSCLYRGCITNRFMIQDGKVRLIELNCITPYTNKGQLEADAERWHWQELQRLFTEIEELGPYGNHRIPPSRFTASWKKMDFIYPIPSPEFPIGGIFLHRDFFHVYADIVWDSHVDVLAVEPEAEPNRSNATISRRNYTADEYDTPVSARLILTTRARRSHMALSHRTESSRSSLNSSLHTRGGRLLLASSSHPYSRRAPRAGKALTSSSDTQSSSSYPDADTTVTISNQIATRNSEFGVLTGNSSMGMDVHRSSPSGDDVDNFFRFAEAFFSSGQVPFFTEDQVEDWLDIY